MEADGFIIWFVSERFIHTKVYVKSSHKQNRKRYSVSNIIVALVDMATIHIS